jgi:hypothetical protein
MLLWQFWELEKDSFVFVVDSVPSCGRSALRFPRPGSRERGAEDWPRRGDRHATETNRQGINRPNDCSGQPTQLVKETRNLEAFGDTTMSRSREHQVPGNPDSGPAAS